MMKKSLGSLSLFGIACVLIAAGAAMSDDKNKNVMKTSETAPPQPAAPVVKTDEEWKKILTPEQYRILREAGTERAFSPVYREFKHQTPGKYFCAGCGAELFSSKEKFDSGCGWPSFWDPSKIANVKTREDFAHGMSRIEVLCRFCGGHLGHVFKGEGFDTPTDKRYCINGIALVFVPDKEIAGKTGEEKSKKE
jgi:peptide-methionine (R)-S-oxide reductase